jgi:hypothetical protein
MTSFHETLASPQPRRRDRWAVVDRTSHARAVRIDRHPDGRCATYEAITAVGDAKRRRKGAVVRTGMCQLPFTHFAIRVASPVNSPVISRPR